MSAESRIKQRSSDGSRLITPLAPDHVRREIRRIVATLTELDESVITGTAHFADDLGIDSMLAMEIIFQVGQRFAIEIYEDEFVSVENLDQAVALIQEKFPASGSTGS